MDIKFNYTNKFLKEKDLNKAIKKAQDAKSVLDSKSGAGNDYLGWLDLPVNYNRTELEEIKKTAKKIREESKALIVIGIGGSYLGAMSAIEMLGDYFEGDFKIYFVGSNMSSSYIYEIYNKVKDIDISVNIISKSGSTTETSVTTRIFLDLMIKKYKDDAYKRIYATTDLHKGVLNSLCVKKGIPMFEIPDNVGGRYSVLTAVGLLPIAVAGFDVDKILDGAAAAYEEMKNNNESLAVKWAARRYLFNQKGYDIEILSCFEPKLNGFIEWYKQLFAESEGKDHKGIFPTGAKFTTDLHSIGQMIQDGKRNIIETIIDVKEPTYEMTICPMEDNLDGLDFLLGKNVSYANSCALKATALAHRDGGVPVSILEIEKLDEFNYGYLVYLFEYTCGVSAYMLGVNPFNQPGVESYKKNMFALLGKPGYEALREEIEKAEE